MHDHDKNSSDQQNTTGQDLGSQQSGQDDSSPKAFNDQPNQESTSQDSETLTEGSTGSETASDTASETAGETLTATGTGQDSGETSATGETIQTDETGENAGGFIGSAKKDGESGYVQGEREGGSDIEGSSFGKNGE